jgi:hypothetical protein
VKRYLNSKLKSQIEERKIVFYLYRRQIYRGLRTGGYAKRKDSLHYLTVKDGRFFEAKTNREMELPYKDILADDWITTTVLPHEEHD